MEELEDKTLEKDITQNVPNAGGSIRNRTGKGKFIIPLILVLILIGAVGYIAYDKYQEKQEEVFQSGIIYGVEALSLKVFNEAIMCKPIPINNGSLEVNLIATECLTIPQE